MHAALLNALQNGATLVTANARLARELRREFDQECRAAGQALWEWPAILPWPSWVEQCWNDCVHAAPAPEPVLLSAAQELLVWERIVEDSPQGRGLLNTAATAEAAAAAYNLAHAWDLPLAGNDFDSEDAAAFLAWARSFDEEQSRAGWLAPARLPREVAHRMEGGRITPPRAPAVHGLRRTHARLGPPARCIARGRLRGGRSPRRDRAHGRRSSYCAARCLPRNLRRRGMGPHPPGAFAHSAHRRSGAGPHRFPRRRGAHFRRCATPFGRDDAPHARGAPSMSRPGRR